MNESEIQAWRSGLNTKISWLKEVCSSVAYLRPADDTSIIPIEDACYDLLNHLKSGWPLFRQGRVGRPRPEPLPPVQRRQKLTLNLTLEDLDL